MAILLGSLVAPAAASAASPAPIVSAHLPGVPCSLSATLHLDSATETMTYGGSLHCTGGNDEKTIDVVPQVSNVIAGKRHWFNVTLAGRYQGPTPVKRLRVGDSRHYVPSHTYRLLVFGEVRSANGHVATATVCTGCSRLPPGFGISPSNTFHAEPSTAAHVAGTSCTLIQDGLTFTLVNGSYVVNYGARTDCGRVAAKRTVTTCVQVGNRSHGRNVWFTVAASCLSSGPTSIDPAEVSTARTAHLGHGYRIMARTTVTQGVTRSATVFSAAAGP
ncbi:MAG TPA: hypothetical protein VFH80_17305 [Solirubrobacteraceae bacterium]|nr:hypothetical protein [Solirubrobacteraceae bacterium]